MKLNRVAFLLAAAAILVASAQAQDLNVEMAPDAMNATANATASEAAAEAPVAPTEFPAFNYEVIFPAGVFNAEAYGSWLNEVTAFYTNMYGSWATEGARAAEGFYGAAFNPATYNPATYFGGFGFGFPGFRPSFGGFGGPFVQAGEAAIAG